MMRERGRMKNHPSGGRKRSVRRSPVVPCSLLLNKRNRLRFLLPRPRSSTHAPSKGKRSRSKVQQASPVQPDSSDDEPLSDKTDEPEPKSRKKDQTTPDLMIVDNDDDPLPETPKGMRKKEKSHAYTQQELDGLELLLLRLKS